MPSKPKTISEKLNLNNKRISNLAGYEVKIQKSVALL